MAERRVLKHGAKARLTLRIGVVFAWLSRRGGLLSFELSDTVTQGLVFGS